VAELIWTVTLGCHSKGPPFHGFHHSQGLQPLGLGLTLTLLVPGLGSVESLKWRTLRNGDPESLSVLFVEDIVCSIICL